MNALTAIIATRCWVVIVDEIGPIGHSYPLSDTSWPSLPLETLLQLAKTAHPGLPVQSVKWAENPRHYTISDPVLLVSIPGTHELPAKGKKRQPKKRVEADPYAYDPSEDLGRDPSYWRRSGIGALAPVVAAVPAEPGPKCSCGIGHTLSSFRALPLVSASDRTEGFTAIHSESHTCTCGAVLHFETKRLLGDRR